MKLIKRAILWLVTVAIPVFIAACYGAAYRFSNHGRVQDSDTQEGIEGIQVTCVTGDGVETSMTYSDPEGSFFLNYDEPCSKLVAEDVDEELNGSYEPTEIPFSEGVDFLIEMDKVQ